MRVTDSRRLAVLEAQVLRQAAEIGQLRETVHRLTSENSVLRIERDEARGERDALRIELDAVRADLNQTRRQHADTKRQMGELVNALAHSDERLCARWCAESSSPRVSG